MKVIMAADLDIQDYLWTIICTMGRVGEINRLQWKDVNLAEMYLVLYTSKKRGGFHIPRIMPLSQRLFSEVLG